MSDACKTVFDEVKKAKKHRYVVFVIKDDTLIDVEAIGGRDASYEDYVTDIQKAGKGMCRYGLFDYEYLHTVQGTAEVGTEPTPRGVGGSRGVGYGRCGGMSLRKHLEALTPSPKQPLSNRPSLSQTVSNFSLPHPDSRPRSRSSS